MEQKSPSHPDAQKRRETLEKYLRDEIQKGKWKNEIMSRAQKIYENRKINGIAGDPQSDWEQAEKEIINERIS